MANLLRKSLLLLLLFAAPLYAAEPVHVAVAASATSDVHMADQVKAEFLHAWTGYKRYAWGHDDLAPLSRKPHDWYATSLLMSPVDALDTLVLMGEKGSRRRTRTDRDKTRSRPGYLRQEFRDHDPSARRPALRLPADRRRTSAAQGRRSRHAPSARVRIADRTALRRSKPAHGQDARHTDQPGRDRHPAAGIRHAGKTHRQARVLRQGQARPGRNLETAFGDRPGRLRHRR